MRSADPHALAVVYATLEQFRMATKIAFLTHGRAIREVAHYDDQASPAEQARLEQIASSHSTQEQHEKTD